MITQITRENLEEAILGEHGIYNELSLIADKLRTIYTALGWTHMTQDFSSSDELVDELTQDVLEAMLSDKEDVMYGTAGLIVRGRWEDEYLELDYSFDII